jgi:hypothetical protein
VLGADSMGAATGDAMVGSGARMSPVAARGGGGRGKASEWFFFCNLVHLVLANRFPSCLYLRLAL